MTNQLAPPELSTLRNQLDFTRVAFSDRGSRVMVFQASYQSQLYVKLAERLTSIDPGIETYLQRPPFIHSLYLIDAEGNPLEFEITSFPQAIYLSTRLGDFELVFGDNHTLAFGLPANITAGIHFHVSPQFWKIMDDGGKFISVRDLEYISNGETIANVITPEKGGYTVDFIVRSDHDSTIALEIGRETRLHRRVEPFSTYHNEAKKRWEKWFAQVPPVAEQYRQEYAYAWWVMANNLVKPKGSIYYEAMMPSKSSYVGLWLWDSAIHALAFRHVDPLLARNQIRAMLACQLPDGMFPDAVYDEGIISEIDHPIRAKVTKPPILAWAALKLHETAPDLEFLQEIYVPLVRWNAWWFSMNDDDVDGLAQYNHPYSSGLDDNPLWDYGMPVESPDLNTYLCVQMGSLAVMAEILGMDSEAGMWRRRASAIVQRMIQDFWDNKSGVFRATHYDQPIPVLTPFNLYPLWTGLIPEAIKARLLEHLTNPDEFWGDLAIPSVARNDPHYQPDTMWRGPVWANVNYFFIESLTLIGEHALGRELRTKTLDMIARQPGMYEYYHAETGQPPPKAANSFGWTAAIFIDLAIAASHE